MAHQSNDISPAELKAKLDQGTPAVMIDVREPLEFFTYNIGGENIPLGRLPGQLEELKYNKSEEIVVICQRGIRSETARRILALSGFINVKNLTGGLLAYKRITE